MGEAQKWMFEPSFTRRLEREQSPGQLGSGWRNRIHRTADYISPPPPCLARDAFFRVAERETRWAGARYTDATLGGAGPRDMANSAITLCPGDALRGGVAGGRQILRSRQIRHAAGNASVQLLHDGEGRRPFWSARAMADFTGTKHFQRGNDHARVARQAVSVGRDLGRQRRELRAVLRMRRQSRLVPLPFARRRQGDGANHAYRAARFDLARLPARRSAGPTLWISSTRSL